MTLADVWDGACALLSLPYLAFRVLRPARPPWNYPEETTP